MTPRRSFADLVESFAASLRVNKAKPIGLKLRRDGPSGGALEWLATCKICGTDLPVATSAKLRTSA